MYLETNMAAARVCACVCVPIDTRCDAIDEYGCRVKCPMIAWVEGAHHSQAQTHREEHEQLHTIAHTYTHTHIHQEGANTSEQGKARQDQDQDQDKTRQDNTLVPGDKTRH